MGRAGGGLRAGHGWSSRLVDSLALVGLSWRAYANSTVIRLSVAKTTTGVSVVERRSSRKIRGTNPETGERHGNAQMRKNVRMGKINWTISCLENLKNMWIGSDPFTAACTVY